VAKKHPTRESGVAGVVERFDADEGWGVIVAPEVVHAGQQVRFTYEHAGFLQDGCRYRALKVWPQTRPFRT
jgi:hypothetical protein